MNIHIFILVLQEAFFAGAFSFFDGYGVYAFVFVVVCYGWVRHAGSLLRVIHITYIGMHACLSV